MCCSNKNVEMDSDSSDVDVVLAYYLHEKRQ